MNKDDWINDVTGRQWKKYARGPDCFDCWGLVVDFFYRVHSSEIDDIKGYIDGTANMADSFEEKSESWKEYDFGYVAVSFSEEGLATHIGVIIGDRVIHAFGSNDSGQVYNHTLSQFKRIYRGNIKTYAWIG